MNPETSNTAKPLPPVEILREYFAYDPETGIVRWKKRPGDHSNVFPGDEVGSCKKRGYRHLKFRGLLFPLHRVVWALASGKDPYGYHLDHINGVRHDNRWCNLRLADDEQNAHNSSHESGKSGFRNVHWDGTKVAKPWRVRFRCKGLKPCYGRFATVEEAAAVAKRVRAELFGEFASDREKLGGLVVPM